MKATTMTELRALRAELEAAGFTKTHAAVSDDPAQSGVFYAHADGRTAVIRAGAIHYSAAQREGGAA